MSEATKIGKEYFKLNPVNKIEVLDSIDVPTQVEAKKPYEENVTDLTQSELIKRVFENKAMTDLKKSQMAEFEEGGDVEGSNPDQEVWTPYEFLHTLLPKVYGKEYVVSDAVADKLYAEIEKEEAKLDEYIAGILAEEGVPTIFQLNPDVLTKIELQKKGLESKKIFISQSELQAYVLTNPDLDKDNYVKEITISKEDLIDKGIILLDLADGLKWVYRYDYLSGNIQHKITDVQLKSAEYKKHLTEEQYTRQLDSLNKARNPLARITFEGQNKIFIHPNSDFAKSEVEFTVREGDWKFFEGAYQDMSLKEALVLWMKDPNEVDPSSYKVTQGWREVIPYYINGEVPKESDERVKINLIQNTQIDGEHIFQLFLNDALNEDCKQRLEGVWNAKYNNLVLPKLYKIPVALTLSKYFKNNSEFIPNPTQIQSVQFMRNSGSGLLAYGVGVGKTAASILNVSYAIDNGMTKKPLFSVPNATYSKWIADMQGERVIQFKVIYDDADGKEATSVFSKKKEAEKFKKENGGKVHEVTINLKGLLPHLPNIVPLYNLNSDIVRYELKIYTEDEQAQLESLDQLKEYLTSFEDEYDFLDTTRNARIKELYDDFELDTLEAQYRVYANRFEPDWEGKKQAKKSENQKSIFKFWKEGFNAYARELPYKLGTLREFPDNSIFVCTYEGLKNIGAESLASDQRDSINEDTSLFGTILKEVSQGESVSQVRGYGGSGLVMANLLEEAMFGGVGKPKVYLKDLGIDYAVFDESHSFKKVFTQSKGKPQYEGKLKSNGLLHRNTARYKIGSGQPPSALGLSAFAAVRYIQMNNDNKNVIHLTATPFTNDPIEVYSMLALTNYQTLVNAGYRWVEDFYDAFMKISYEIRYTASQQIRKEQILAGYNNAPQMRSLIFFLMDYKSGEDANIKRPDKLMMPSYEKGIETIIPAHPLQAEAFKLIKSYIRGDITIKEVCDLVADDVDVVNMTDNQVMNIILQEGTDRQKDKWELVDVPLDEKARKDAEKVAAKIVEAAAKESMDEEGAGEEELAVVRILKGLSFMKQVTLSPYLFTCRKAGGDEPTYKEYVESSPKILYTVKAIKSTRDFEEANGLRLSGTVMYMNDGVHPSILIQEEDGYVKRSWKQGSFDKIKEYFVKEYGYTEGQVSIIHGGIPRARKETEKNKFLSGESLVLIGSATISTGVDLQNNASSLMTLTFGWNPTDNEQINGRIHRQGNRFAGIRIVYPMIENSADPIIFQLLQEKTNRIKEIWDRDGKTSALDLRDFNPSDLKRKLITDPKDKVTYWLEENLKDLEDEKIMWENRQQSLRNASDDYSTLENYREPMRGMLTVIDGYRKHLKQQEGLKEQKEKTDALIAEFAREPQVMVKELEKLNKNIYDYQKDPDSRYTPIDLKEATDEDLFKHITNWVTNSGSWWETQDRYSISNALNTYTNENYPDYYAGKWISDADLLIMQGEYDAKNDEHDKSSEAYHALDNDLDELMREHNWEQADYEADERYAPLKSSFEEAKKKTEALRQEYRVIENKMNKLNGGMSVQFSNHRGITTKAIDWKNAKKLFDKHLERLLVMGVEATEIEQAKQMVVDRVTDIRKNMDSIHSKTGEMFELYTQEAEDSISIAPSVDERVAEFSALNAEYLIPQIATNKEDEAPVAKPVAKKEIKPKLKVEVKKPEPAKVAVDMMGYTFGDKWSKDFPYEGMLNAALGIDEHTPIPTLTKLYESLVDVNYADLVVLVANVITAIEVDLRMGTYTARSVIEDFKKEVLNELANFEVEEGDEIDLSDVSSFVSEKIDLFTMMLDMEDDEEKITFLNDKIELFEMMREG